MIIIFTREAEKDLSKLDKIIIQNVKDKLNKFIENQNNVDVKKIKGYKNKFRIREGNYRIIYEIIYGELKILQVLQIKHRQEAYKRL